jgi:hypothetical protein
LQKLLSGAKMRAKIRKKVIKMIKIITLIPASLAYLALAGCSGDNNQSGTEVNADTSISGTPTTTGGPDPLKDLQDQGKLPNVGTGPKTTPSTASNTEGLSVYPPNVDGDQDNVPNSAINGHPEIALDNCPNVYNPGQEDADHDGVGDACE